MRISSPPKAWLDQSRDAAYIRKAAAIKISVLKKTASWNVRHHKKENVTLRRNVFLLSDNL